VFCASDEVRALDFTTVSEEQVSLKVEPPSLQVIATKCTIIKIEDIKP
jgi:hypothetical protein